MNALIWLAAVSFGLSLVLTTVFRDIFRSYGVVDEPDQGRKIHKYPIPRVGGIAVAASYAASFYIVQWSTASSMNTWRCSGRCCRPRGRFSAVGIHRRSVGAEGWQKLLGQRSRRASACQSGILVVDVVGFHERAWWTIPVTMIWLLACSNAFNLVDGMDGLATGVGPVRENDHDFRGRAATEEHRAGDGHRAAVGQPARFPLLQLQSGNDLPGRLREPADRISAGLFWAIILDRKIRRHCWA